jgi:histidinol-phosphate/aromatic aminotransferase/cobyric acid decarboxylase-like protein
LIKKFSTPEVLQNCMRVTVGSSEENEEFLGALKDIMVGEGLESRST